MIRKAGKFTGLLIIEAVSALLIGLVVLAALFFWRLSTGPVKVDFLTPWIEQTLKADAVRPGGGIGFVYPGMLRPRENGKP